MWQRMVVVCWWTAPSTKSARCPDSCSLRLLRELCIGVMMEARRPLSWRSAIADADGSTCHGGWAGAGGARSCLRCPLPSSPAAADARAVASKRAMTDVTAPTASSLNSSGARRTSARAVVRAPALFVGQSAGWRKGIRDHSPPPAPGRPRNLASSGRGVARVQRCACRVREERCRVREEQRRKGRGWHAGAGDGMCPGGERVQEGARKSAEAHVPRMWQKIRSESYVLAIRR